VFLDEHIPDLLAIPPNVDLTKDRAYTSGALVFQDKASCFPAYLLDPLPQDGDVIDSCAAPGNKTTHLASIVAGHSGDFDVADPESVRRLGQRIHAFEKDKFRAKTLEKMVGLAGSDVFTTIHGNCDFLKADPNSAEFAKVGALLLDPSCSGSGIVGRDDMPELHLPDADAKADVPGQKGRGKPKSKTKEKEKAEKAAEKARAAKEKESLKRKRDDVEDSDEDVEVIVDDDGIPTAITSAKDLETRLAALSAFQLSLLLHAMSFPAAQKITYSTCSIHVEENESVVLQALDSTVARERGWRVLRRGEQVRGMREWPVRGDGAWCAEKCGERAEEVGEACIRANKGDGRGTMGFFVCGFVRDARAEMEGVEVEKRVLRDAGGRIVRDAMGVPILAFSEVPKEKEEGDVAMEEEGEEWDGFGDDEASGDAVKDGEAETPSVVEVKAKEEGSSTPAKKKRRKAKKKAD
jgi:putative methyltransferase